MEFDSLPSKVEIDVQKSILNSITDTNMTKLIEIAKQLKITMEQVGISLYEAVKPIADFYKEATGCYNWQEEIASF